MTENDIYNNEAKYKKALQQIKSKIILEKPIRGIYYCKNKENIEYFERLVRRFEVDDPSYVRRLKLLQTLKLITFIVECNLKDVNGLERDNLIIKIRETTKSINQLKRISQDVKYLGKLIFDEDYIPKFFINFDIKTDKSRQKAREDKLTYEEYERIIRYFNKNLVVQTFLATMKETLVRPQELCYIKIKNVDFLEQHAIVYVTEHGKEGIKKLLIMDTFPYLVKLLNSHKNRNNKESYLFLSHYGNQMTPFAINKHLKKACKKLEIDKPITCYSFKRFGVTFRRLRGDDDVTIQRIAGWTSTKQLKTYDQSNQDDVFKIELAKRGLVKDKKYSKFTPQTKPCPYCGELVGFAESACPNCSHIVDQDLIRKRVETDKEIIQFMKILKKEMPISKLKEIMAELSGE
jgi:integrase